MREMDYYQCKRHRLVGHLLNLGLLWAPMAWAADADTDDSLAKALIAAQQTRAASSALADPNAATTVNLPAPISAPATLSANTNNMMAPPAASTPLQVKAGPQLILPPLPAPSPSVGGATNNASTEQNAGASTFGTVFDPAFQDMTKKQFPLTPEQIKALRQIFQSTQRASVAPIEVPTPTLSSQTVSLSPGSVPPVIKMATGYVSSVVFVDETGQPWPVAAYSIGNPSAFNILWDNTSNLILIQSIGAYQSTNMAVRLVGLSIPVMLTIVSDQQKVDYRVDLRVAGRGPQAKKEMMAGDVSATDPVLMAFLDGVPPYGSERLRISGGPAEAWRYEDKIIVRTRLTILSPGWLATMASADGMHIYEMESTPLILGSQNGEPVTLKVEGL